MYSVGRQKWAKAAAVRWIKTMAQTAVGNWYSAVVTVIEVGHHLRLLQEWYPVLTSVAEFQR